MLCKYRNLHKNAMQIAFMTYYDTWPVMILLLLKVNFSIFLGETCNNTLSPLCKNIDVFSSKTFFQPKLLSAVLIQKTQGRLLKALTAVCKACDKTRIIVSTCSCLLLSWLWQLLHWVWFVTCTSET